MGVPRLRPAGALAFAIPLVAYAFTLCPTVYVGDSGEMVTLAHTLGVAQPTGFPLYCLLGKLATLIPIGTLAARVNALSAISLAVAGFAIHRLLARIVRPELALIGSLTFTLGQAAWSQATIARTYPLTLALSAIELDLALLVAAAPPGSRRFLGLALLSGVGLGTHLLSVLIGPVMLYLWWREPARSKAASIALVLLGLSLYAYLPLRAPVTTYNAYGPLSSARELWDYLRQKRYARKQWSRSPANLRAFGRILAHQFAFDQPFGLVIWPVALLGARVAVRHHTTLFAFLAVPSAANAVILLGYGDDTDLPFLPRYFLWVLMALAILWAIGLSELARTRGHAVVTGTAAALLCIGALATGHSQNRSGTVFPRDYAAALIEPLPPESLLFLAGDASTLMIDYLQYCEGKRRDLHCGELETYRAHIAPIFASGKTVKFPIFANFLPRDLPPGLKAVHAGLLWQITTGEPALDRARFWREHPFDGVTTDPALVDYEAAAVAGEILYHRGLDELLMKETARARATFAAALAASPENRLIHYSIAKTYVEEGWTEEARALVERGLALDVTAQAEGPDYRAARYRDAGLTPDGKAASGSDAGGQAGRN